MPPAVHPQGGPGVLGQVGRLPVEEPVHRWAKCFSLGLHTLLDAPSEVDFARVEELRKEWMDLALESGLAAAIGQVMQEAPGCHSLTLLPKQHEWCTLVGHDMAHWPAMVRSWGVLVPPTTALQHLAYAW